MNTLTSRRTTAAALLLLSATAFGAQVTTTHSTVKVLPTAALPESTPPVLVAARNEFVSFQVVVRADSGALKNVRATFNGLSGPGNIGPENVQLYREEYLNLTKVSFQGVSTGRWPDPLVPAADETVGETRNAFPFDVPAGETRVIWVDVLVPLDIESGLYEGSVVIQGDGFEQPVPVKLTVLPTDLPSTSSLNTAFLFHRAVACTTHTGNQTCGSEQASYELRAKYQKLALEHRVTLSNTLTYPADGDWATFDARFGPWLDGTAPSRLPGARMTTAQFPGRREAAQFQGFEQHMKSRGWLDRAYDYTGDEPPWGITFAEALSRLKAVKSAAPTLRTLLTTTVQAADEFGISPHLDLLVPVINHMDGLEAPYIGDQRAKYDGFLEQPGKELWLYQSCMSHGCAFGTNAPENKPGKGWPSYMIDASAARNRAMQWLVFLERAQGELYYETALALDTSWTDVFRFNGNGDGTLFYPGLPSRVGGTTHVPLPSLRLKQIRSGMQDFEWLKKVADAGDPELARQIARELVPTAYSVGDNGGAFEGARVNLIARWVELSTDISEQERQEILEQLPENRSPILVPDRPVVGCTAGAGVPAAGALLALLGLALRRARRSR